MQVIEKNIYIRPVVLGTVCETQMEVRSRWGSDLPTNARSDPLPLWQVGGMGVFFSSQTHNVEGCTARVFVLRCGTTIKRVDPLCIRKPRPLAPLGFGLWRSTLAHSSSTDRANASQFVKSGGRGVFEYPQGYACQRESRGVQFFNRIVVQDQQ